MAQPTQLIFSDNPGAVPATYIVPPSLDLVIQSIVARWNGAGAAGSFLPCLGVYSQDGHLIGRFHPNTELAAGDTAVVTYAPFLRTTAAATPSTSAAEWPTDYTFVTPEFFLPAASPFPSNTHYATIELDAAQALGYKLVNKNIGTGFYVDGATIYFGCRLGPEGSYWTLSGLFETDPAHGKLDFAFATAAEDDTTGTWTDPTATLNDPAWTTYIPTWFKQPFAQNGQPTVDLYTPANGKNAGFYVANFRIVGTDGGLITGDAALANDPNGTSAAFPGGGAGIWWLRVKVNGKNAASTGFKCPITRLRLSRSTVDGWTLN